MRVLVAEAQKAMRRVMAGFLEERQCRVSKAANVQELMLLLEQEADLLILDVTFIQDNPVHFFERLRRDHAQLPVVVTAYPDMQDPSLRDSSLRRWDPGIVDCLVKPFAIARLQAVFDKVCQRRSLSQPEVAYLHLDALPSVERHPAMRRVAKLLGSVAESNVTVLISGESGVGKEIVAKSLHQKSLRQREAFVGLNCASVPGTLLEVELFGCERGAYTSAVTRRIGKFELAQKGTLLLDEISEMDIALQAKLLRVIQEREMYRLGGEATIALDVRLLVTTNRNLHNWVSQGKFREDLFYRLNVISIQVPPLRERVEDIPVFAAHILERARRDERHGLAAGAYRFSERALRQLIAYPWPGNIRELENVVIRTLFLTQGDEIDEICFDDVPAAKTTPSLIGTIQDMEKKMIEHALALYSGNRVHAATALGISVRTLHNKLRLYRQVSEDLSIN